MAGDMPRPEEDGVELMRRGRRVGRSRPRASDSLRVRIVVGSTRAEDGCTVGREVDCFDLDKPRAAAPRDKRVVRLARRAASWSGWWYGDMAL